MRFRFRGGPIFVPEEPLILPPGIWRLALTSSAQRVQWEVGAEPEGHINIATGKGDPATWTSGRRFRQERFGVGQYAIIGEWRGPSSWVNLKAPLLWKHTEIAGIFPHLAMFNTAEPGECGIGAVVNWADNLWAVTYSPYNQVGSPDKLFRIDTNHNIYVRPESVGGTPANRMIHPESQQLIIGSHLIDRHGKVRTIPVTTMPGRLTGNARHLIDPANKIYYASMEEGFYEVDVHTLAVKVINRDRGNFAWGNHGKGLYSGQGRVIYANNGGSGHGGIHKLNQAPVQVGSLNQWNGKFWEEIHRTGFLDVSGPGGIRGNANPDTDPIWAIGWDYRSVLLKVLDSGKWSTYRLPKASHTMDGPHGYNTEWPRIGEIGLDGERLIYVHGMFWRLPTAFKVSNSAGLRPRSTYLKMISDSTPWQGRIAFACNDLSNEIQAIRLNPRKVRGKLVPSISHANLWFVEPEQLDDFGVPIGRGSVWMYDDVEAGETSDEFQIGGWDKRLLHLSHESPEPVDFTVELDGNAWKKVTVARYRPISLSEAPAAEWVRLRSSQGAKGVIATFHYANMDQRSTASPVFAGIAMPSQQASSGLVRIKSTDGCPLGLATDNAYYEMGTDMSLKRVYDAESENALRNIAAIPEFRLSADSASVIYIDEEGGKRYRLPRGHSAFEDGVPARIDREVCRERNLFNAHGTFYELPYRNAGGFTLIRPITTPNRRIHDYCSWRGLFVMTGIASAAENDRIIRSQDGEAAVWLGAIDELWKMGKVGGIGGPWKSSAVVANEPSDPYLMNGYDEKILTISASSPTTITVQVDITGYGDWRNYRDFAVSANQPRTHKFPADFSAYWLRTVANSATTATAQLLYQ